MKDSGLQEKSLVGKESFIVVLLVHIVVLVYSTLHKDMNSDSSFFQIYLLLDIMHCILVFL